MWCIPPAADGEFVAAMADVLGVYHRPYDPKRPQVNPDEAGEQRVGETRVPLPARPGEPARYDSEYVRNGTANVFVAFEPPAGWRHVAVTDTRTRADRGWLVKGLVDGRYKDAAPVVSVMDDLDTHTAGSLYEAFPPDEARRIADRLAIHYTPGHGSGPTVAEIALAAPANQCLGDRVEDKAALARAVAAWGATRNERKAGADWRFTTADWRFTTADARIKLKRLYPSVRA